MRSLRAMRVHVFLGALVLAALASAGCERRDGKIIFHEDEAKEKTGEAVKKAGEGLETLGKKTEELGERAKERAREEHPAPPPQGVGGGPNDACDAGATDCPTPR